MDGTLPDHSTFSKNRHGRFRDSDLLRRLFEATARRCMAEGIVGGQGFVVDASMIRADASRQKGVASSADLDPEDASRAVGEYLAVLDAAAFGAATEVPMVLAASPVSGIRNLPELVEWMRQRGERVSFATAGNGTTSHLAPSFLLHLTGLEATLVAYRSSGPAMNDLAAGVVDAVIDQTVTMIPAHRGGQAVAIAVSAPGRLPQLPDVPTFAEGGVPGFDMVIWNAFAAPRGTPDKAVARLQQALEAALADPDLQRRLTELATTVPPPGARGPEAMRRLVVADVAKWTEFVRQTGLPRD